MDLLIKVSLVLKVMNKEHEHDNRRGVRKEKSVST